FFGDAYEEVMRLLVDGLGFAGSWRNDWTVPTTGAIAQARQRLGAEPLRVLFERVAVPCAQRGTRGAWLGSRRLMAIDGFVLDVPDTDENAVAFGRSGGVTNPAPFPQVRPAGSAQASVPGRKAPRRRGNQKHRGSANIDEPSGIQVRGIEYEVTNREGKGEIFCLITTIMDPEDATAAELAAAYQQRWEFES